MLSDKAIQALRPDPALSTTTVTALTSGVALSDSKTWRKDSRWQGARRTFTIDAYPAVRLADARKQALELNAWIKEGVDPRTQAPGQQRKQAKNTSRPFSNIAQTCMVITAPAGVPATAETCGRNLQAAGGLTVSGYRFAEDCVFGSNGEPINPQAMSASELYQASFAVNGRGARR